MSIKEYKDGCKGCDISREIERKPGGIIHFEGDWILNHYAGDEGFLGWMALQPRFHRMKFTDFTDDETKALGKNIQDINTALCEYWSIHFPKDPLEKLYMVCFHESEEYHIHIHLIPRSKELGGEDPTKYMAWKTFKRTETESFPPEYRVKDRKGSWLGDQKVVALMSYLRGTLSKMSAKKVQKRSLQI
jgi:diadenosine tetraphosphate (Ap4A) HIT family hydrolase